MGILQELDQLSTVKKIKGQERKVDRCFPRQKFLLNRIREASPGGNWSISNTFCKSNSLRQFCKSEHKVKERRSWCTPFCLKKTILFFNPKIWALCKNTLSYCVRQNIFMIFIFSSYSPIKTFVCICLNSSQQILFNWVKHVRWIKWSNSLFSPKHCAPKSLK